MLMRPDKRVTAIIGGVLARAIARFGVDVFAVSFLSNHFHLILRSADGSIPEFMQYVRCNIAKKVGGLRGWHGKFWDRRYDAEPILDDEALEARLRYVVSQGVKEGLVSFCREWPGLNSLPELLNGERRQFSWPATVHAAAQAKDDDQDSPRYELVVRPLPAWEPLSEIERRERVARMVADVEEEARAARQGKAALGAEAVLAQDPLSTPPDSKHSPRPLCHTTRRELAATYKAKYVDWAAAFHAASIEYRQGRPASFPPCAHRPPWRPKLQPPDVTLAA